MPKRKVLESLNLAGPSKAVRAAPSRTPAFQPASPTASKDGSDAPLRASCVGMLTTALQQGGNCSHAHDLAKDIEAEVYHANRDGVNQEYKTCARTLAANLKRNSTLRARVCSGDVAPDVLVRMDSQALATAEQQQEIEALKDEQFKRVTLGSTGGVRVTTTEYQCPTCRSTSCDYLDTGRRDIGKSETWGAKDAEGRARQVTCLSCGERWEESGLV